MAKKPTVTTLQSGFNSTEVLNENFENIRDAFDNTLSLDGSTPNAMQGDLDLNGNNLIGATGLLINGTDYLADVEAAKVAALVAQAAAELAENNAETAEVNAEASETAAGLSATAAATSATNAGASETAASASATASATSATNSATSASQAATSASAAAVSEGNAATSETNAANSVTSASGSASTSTAQASAASASATNAATSASNAATSETNAAASETAAAASETNAAASESAVATSATNAATSEANAATSASTATTQASNAATSASAASTSASNAATSETNAASSASSAASSASSAQASKDAALAALDSFDDRYLGQKASDPTLDNDGDALVAGALYFNTTDDVMKVYEGSVWVAAYASLSGAMIGANNLSDVASVSDSRNNLGLGAGDTPTFAGIDVTGTVTADGLTVDNNATHTFVLRRDNSASPFASIDARAISGATAYYSGTLEHYNGQWRIQTQTTSTTRSPLNRATFDANGDISFYEDTGTTPKFFWDASAESLGIGTSSPASYAKLTVQGTGTEAIPTDGLVQSYDASTLQTIWNADNSANYSGIKLETRTSGASGWLIANQWKSSFLGDLVFHRRTGASSSGEAMRIDSSGKVGIRAGSGVKIGSGLGFAGDTTSAGSGSIDFYDVSTGALVIDGFRAGYLPNSGIHFRGDGTERMRIDSSGNVGIGITNPTEKLHVSGNILATGDVTAFSDERLKTEIETISEAVDKVKQLRGVTFQKDGRDSLGVIAQEVQKVLPEVVHESGDYLSVAYGNIVGLLIEAVKEQQVQIDELKARTEEG